MALLAKARLIVEIRADSNDVVVPRNLSSMALIDH